MSKNVYILKTDHWEKSYLDKDLFFSDWAQQLASRIIPEAYVIDYSGYDTVSYKDYQSELEDRMLFPGAKGTEGKKGENP